MKTSTKYLQLAPYLSNHEKLEALPLVSGIQQESPFSLFPFNIIPLVLANKKRKEKLYRFGRKIKLYLFANDIIVYVERLK